MENNNIERLMINGGTNGQFNRSKRHLRLTKPAAAVLASILGILDPLHGQTHDANDNQDKRNHKVTVSVGYENTGNRLKNSGYNDERAHYDENSINAKALVRLSPKIEVGGLIGKVNGSFSDFTREFDFGGTKLPIKGTTDRISGEGGVKFGPLLRLPLRENPYDDSKLSLEASYTITMFSGDEFYNPSIEAQLKSLGVIPLRYRDITSHQVNLLAIYHYGDDKPVGFSVGGGYYHNSTSVGNKEFKVVGSRGFSLKSPNVRGELRFKAGPGNFFVNSDAASRSIGVGYRQRIGRR